MKINAIYKEKNFKETTIGKIPRDWQVVKIGEACEVVGGGTPSTTVKEYWNGKIPFVTPTDVTKLEERNVNFLSKTDNYITEEGLKNSSANLLPPGSVLLTSRATIGSCVINRVPVATNQGFANLICKEHTHNLYVLYLMRFIRKKLEQLAAGSTFKEIARTIVRNLTIQRPPLAEQQKIADVLSTVDEAIQKTNEIIAETERLKEGLMQELLTRGIGHKEFKDSEIGKIPKEWSVTRLEEIGTFQYGFTASATSQNTGIKLLRITDIKENGMVDWSKVPYCKINEGNLKKYALRNGDILFARIGATTGKTCYIGQSIRSVFGSYLIRFNPAESDVDMRFLYFFTQSWIYWLQVNRKKEGQLKKGLNTKTLGSLKIPLPAFHEQQKIAGILSTVDKKLEIERKGKAELEETKQGLMDLLLTGKIRVKVD
jgi:type I restriction enzyme S subunit